MVIKTRDFGEMELDINARLVFREPILGFEDLHEYVLLSDDEMGPGLLWLQSLENPDVCFILLDPLAIGLDDYQPNVLGDVAGMLELDEPPLIRIIAVVPDDFKDTTVNLKSPILINPKKQLAAQVILDADLPIRLRLFAEEGK